jgi:hypothetical protein
MMEGAKGHWKHGRKEKKAKAKHLRECYFGWEFRAQRSLKALYEIRNVKEGGPSIAVAAPPPVHHHDGVFSRWDACRDGYTSYTAVGGVAGH